MSLSKPFRFENNRIQNPWIASTIIGREISKSKSYTVKVLKHVCGPLDDGSMVREVTDGELFITTVFSKECILKFYTQLDECTPPEWTNALLILKEFYINFQPHTTFEKSEYVLYVDHFILWDLQQGFERKNVLIYCMEDIRIKEKAKEIWKLKQMEENDTMDSIPLTQLIEQMGEDDSQIEECVTGITDEETSKRPRLTPKEQLTRSLKVGQFLIDIKQENLLNRIKEWQIDYKPSLSDEDSSVITPELDPNQPTLKDDHMEVNRGVKDKSVPNRKGKDNLTESQNISVNGVIENVYINQSQASSNYMEKENLDETDQLLLQIGQDNIRKSGTDRNSNMTKCSGTSKIISEYIESRTSQTESAKQVITSDTNNAVQSTNRIVQHSDNEVLGNLLDIYPDKPRDCEQSLKNKIICQPDEMDNNTKNVVIADVETLKPNKTGNVGKNGHLESNLPDSGPFDAFPGTQEFTPTKSPIYNDDNNQPIVSSTQEVVSNNFIRSRHPVSPLDIQTQEFVPHCLSEDFMGSQVLGLSPQTPDSTSRNENDTPPLFEEDSYEKMETECSGRVNSQSESSEESIKFIALPIGKVTTGKKCSEKENLLGEMCNILNRGDMPCRSTYRPISKDEIKEYEGEEVLNVLKITNSGDGHHVDSLLMFGKHSDRHKGKSKLEPDDDDDDIVSENNVRVKRRKLISAFEQQNCITSDKNNNDSHDTGSNEYHGNIDNIVNNSDNITGSIQIENDNFFNESDGNISGIQTDNADSLNKSDKNTGGTQAENDKSLNESDGKIGSIQTENDSLNESQGNIGSIQADLVDSFNESDCSKSDIQNDSADSLNSSSTFRTVLNKVLQVMGFTPKKGTSKSEKDKEHISELKGRQLSEDTGQEKSSNLDSEELIVISSTSEENGQSEVEVLTLDSDSGQKEKSASNSVEDFPSQQIEDSDITVSPDTSVDKEEVFARLIETDTPTEIGQKLLSLKFPTHMMDEIGQYYLKM